MRTFRGADAGIKNRSDVGDRSAEHLARQSVSHGISACWPCMNGRQVVLVYIHNHPHMREVGDGERTGVARVVDPPPHPPRSRFCEITTPVAGAYTFTVLPWISLIPRQGCATAVSAAVRSALEIIFAVLRGLQLRLRDGAFIEQQLVAIERDLGQVLVVSPPSGSCLKAVVTSGLCTSHHQLPFVSPGRPDRHAARPRGPLASDSTGSSRETSGETDPGHIQLARRLYGGGPRRAEKRSAPSTLTTPVSPRPAPRQEPPAALLWLSLTGSSCLQPANAAANSKEEPMRLRENAVRGFIGMGACLSKKSRCSRES